MTTAIKTEHPHIVRNPDIRGGEPIISGSSISVAFIARFLHQGVGPDEIVGLYPHLTRAGVYDAISYYFDHQDEIDQIIAASTPEALQKRYGYERGEKGRIRLKRG